MAIAETLNSRAIELTETNSRVDANANNVPRVTAQSPLHVVIEAEVRRLFPAEIRKKLLEVDTITEVHEWICAGTLYTHVAHDEQLAKIYLHELMTHPGFAAMALARALAKKLPPAPPSHLAPLLDRLGVALQLVTLVFLLGIRFAVMASLLSLANPMPLRAMDFTGFFSTIVLPEFWHWPATQPTWLVFVLMIANVWFLLESYSGTKLLEAARRLPFSFRDLPIENWRLDPLVQLSRMHIAAISVVSAVNAIWVAIGSLPDLLLSPSGFLFPWMFVVASCICTATTAWNCTRLPTE